ncbi:MAG: hypothetical protein LLF86_00170 [Nitrospiraceae bacterium]|nr:hypothetical protein [Nitrospiraceae bacterium]
MTYQSNSEVKQMTRSAAYAVPRSVIAGAVFALLAVSFSFILGGLFGAVEEKLKGTLNDSGKAVLETVYQNDAQKMDAVVKKSWSYMIRAHLHGGALGAVALSSIAVMILVTNLGFVARLSSLALGVGALAYSVMWLCAGLRAPALGSTGAAKQSVEALAIVGAGLCILGLLGTLLTVGTKLFSRAAK